MRQSMKFTPVGVDDFEKLIKDNYYYVDKTGLISELLHNLGDANLFTRPRRFGKTLNMSMLAAFFSPESDKSIFTGLSIMNEMELCRDYMGQYPVLFVSLKEIDAAGFDTAFDLTVQIINEAAYKIYPVLKDSGRLLSEEKSLAARLLCTDLTEAELCASLRVLSRLMEKHYGRKVIVLIDEYDVPLAKAHEFGYYDSMVLLIRNMFQQVLKTNSSVKFSVLTGCMRVSKESIFTGLNNLRVLGITDRRFEEHYGFTDREVRDMLTYYGLADRYETVREWYDGYQFGNVRVYCPWDVVNYCNEALSDPHAEPRSYWVNSSGNHVLRRLIQESRYSSVKSDIEKLIGGESVDKSIRQDLTYPEMYDSVDNIWSVLFTTGYLTQTADLGSNRFRLIIPNQEILYVFQEQIMSWFLEEVRGDGKTLSAFCDALLGGDPDSVEEHFHAYLRKTMSLRDTYGKKSMKENYYHGILVGILGVKEGWHISSNRETGDGYSDILVEVDPPETAILIEVKYAEDGNLDAACAKALRQIEERHYADDLYEDGYHHVLKYGIACCRKRCRVMLGKEASCY